MGSRAACSSMLGALLVEVVLVLEGGGGGVEEDGSEGMVVESVRDEKENRDRRTACRRGESIAWSSRPTWTT